MCSSSACPFKGAAWRASTRSVRDDGPELLRRSDADERWVGREVRRHGGETDERLVRACYVERPIERRRHVEHDDPCLHGVRIAAR